MNGANAAVMAMQSCSHPRALVRPVVAAACQNSDSSCSRSASSEMQMGTNTLVLFGFVRLRLSKV
jgi:hypothetical protein